MEDLPVALSDPAASVIGWPNSPGDVALDPAHRIGSLALTHLVSHLGVGLAGARPACA
jgi:hypothetical protein